MHNGHLLKPKSTILPPPTKDLTNNHKLIFTINELGHGVLHAVLQELLTEVAYSKKENAKENEITFLGISTKEKFTMPTKNNNNREHISK